MRFQDFLERVTAKVTRGLEARIARSLPEELRLFGSVAALRTLFERAHIFNLGDGGDIDQAAEEILPDLIEEISVDLPAPFDNMLVFCDTGRGWSCEWHLKAHAYLAKEVASLEQLHRLRFLIDLSEPVLDLPPLTLVAGYVVAPPVDGRPRVILTPQSIKRAKEQLSVGPLEDAGEITADAVFRAATRVALISHPANYIVRTVPKLTPREERRLGSKGIVPAQKKPHYIVIDHEALVDLNPATRTLGPHRPPTPHARRGHWRKLAERCRHAKAAGKARIWVGETYVGEREFEDEQNKYLVVLDRTLGSATAPGPIVARTPAP